MNSNAANDKHPGQPVAGPASAEAEVLAEEHESSERAMAVLAQAMPWVISLLFHLGLFLIMVFLTFVVLIPAKEEEIIVPDAVLSEDPGGQMTPSDVQTKVAKSTVSKTRKFVRKQKVTADTGKTAKPVDIIGVGGGGSAGAAQMGMTTAGGGGPKSSFFGSGGNAYNVVYVIDRSGSMVDTFDLVRMEMLRSIGRLRDSQMFHIILFAEGRPIENRPKKLIPASRENKKQAADFLKDVTPETQTNPIPALDRAFVVLRGARKQGRLIYLLTDGIFPDNEKVLQTIRARNTNKKKRVYINTFLYGAKPDEAVDVLTRIAEENGGKYTYVRYDQ